MKFIKKIEGTEPYNIEDFDAPCVLLKNGTQVLYMSSPKIITLEELNNIPENKSIIIMALTPNPIQLYNVFISNPIIRLTKKTTTPREENESGKDKSNDESTTSDNESTTNSKIIFDGEYFLHDVYQPYRGKGLLYGLNGKVMKHTIYGYFGSFSPLQAKLEEFGLVFGHFSLNSMIRDINTYTRFINLG